MLTFSMTDETVANSGFFSRQTHRSFSGSTVVPSWLDKHTKSDILDYEAKVDSWEYYTPSKQFADFTLLNSLAATTVEVHHNLRTEKDHNILSVELKNTGASIAFAIELSVIDSHTGSGIVPIFWQDNYVSLLPGESRVVETTFDKTASNVSLEVHGWNIDKA